MVKHKPKTAPSLSFHPNFTSLKTEMRLLRLLRPWLPHALRMPPTSVHGNSSALKVNVLMPVVLVIFVVGLKLPSGNITGVMVQVRPSTSIWMTGFPNLVTEPKRSPRPKSPVAAPLPIFRQAHKVSARWIRSDWPFEFRFAGLNHSAIKPWITQFRH